MESNVQLRKIEALADSISILVAKGYKVPLNKKSFERYLEMIDNFEHTIEKNSTYEEQSFEILNNQYLEKILALDPYRKKQVEEETKDLKSDAALEETFRITKDLIEINTTQK